MNWTYQIARVAGWGLLAAAVLLFGAGCNGTKPFPPTGNGAGALTDPVLSIDTIRVGDRIVVVFTDISQPPAPVDQRVRDDGTIMLPFNETFTAAGKRAADLQTEIRERYVGKYYTRLTVTVRVEGRMIHVGGQVRMPGRYDYIGEMRVLDAIKVAGDFTDFARQTRVRVTRANGEEIVVNCRRALENSALDIPLYPGDSVYVPRRIL